MWSESLSELYSAFSAQSVVCSWFLAMGKTGLVAGKYPLSECRSLSLSLSLPFFSLSLFSYSVIGHSN